jgi:hypothetical protein
VSKRYVQLVDETCVGPTSKTRDSKVSRGKNVISRFLSDRELPGRKPSTPGKIITNIACNVVINIVTLFCSFRGPYMLSEQIEKA